MDATLNHAQPGQIGTSVTLFALAIGTVLDQVLHYGPSWLMAAGAVAGGVASLLPAWSAFRDRCQARRHADEEFRRRQRAG